MKKVLALLAVIAGATIAQGQGFIIVQSTSANITTNTGSFYTQVSGVSGKTAVAANGFYYALLFAASTPSGIASPTNSGWTLATLNGGGTLVLNNYVVAGGISGSGTSSGVAVNMAAGTTYSVELVGWSSSLGTSFSTVQGELSSGNWTTNGYFGYTSVSSATPFATAGTGDPFIFPTMYANGALTLWSVAPAGVPEPSTMALAGLGGAALLLFRRRSIK